jgi:hypothetical protein
LKRINQSYTHREKAIASSRKLPKSSFVKYSYTLPRRFKVESKGSMPRSEIFQEGYLR